MSDEAGTRITLRPSIPPMAWLVCAMWVGIAAAESLTWRWRCSGSPRLTLATGCASALAVACLVWLAVTGGAAHRLMLIGLVGGLSIGILYWCHWAGQSTAMSGAGTARWTIDVLGDESTGAFGSRSLARIVGPPADGAVVTVNWPANASVPELGRRVGVFGSGKVPGPDEAGRRSHRSGESGSLTARVVNASGWSPGVRGLIGPLRLWAVQRLRIVGGAAGDLLAGVVAGDRRRLAGSDAEVDFRTTGLTHLIAVSGSHLVVIAAVVSWILARLRWRRWSTAAAVACLVGAYVVFSGVQASAIRAWVMASTGSVACLSGRRSDGGSTLAVAAAALLAAAPSIAFDLGFQLSVAAVAGIVVFARLAEEWLSVTLSRWLRWVSNPVALTLTATMATVPLTVGTFGMLSLVSPVANVLAGPLISVALLAGLAGLTLSLVWPAAGSLMLQAAAVPCAGAISAAHWLASRPYAAVPLTASAGAVAGACWGTLGLLWAGWPRPTKMSARAAIGAAVLAIVILALGPPPPSGVSIEVLDVGQGDAILVRDGVHAVLVDTGPSASQMRTALGRTGLRQLDAVIITHLHADHYGGLGALKGLVKVPIVVFPSGSLSEQDPALEEARRLVGPSGLREVASGAAFSVGRLALSVVSPSVPDADPKTNEGSVVLLAREGHFSALLTGDAEGDVLGGLVASGALGDLDVAKVGHHGSSGAMPASVLSVLRPEWAVISVGKGNRFGHPAPSTLADLAGASCRIVRTDECGDITIRVTPEGEYQVDVARRSATSEGVQRVSDPSVSCLRGGRACLCARLGGTGHRARPSFRPMLECYGEAACGVQTRLPHIWRSRAPPRTCTGQAQAGSGRACRPRLQLRDI